MGRDTVEVWGTGTPRRELLYNADMAEACVHLLQLPEHKFSPLLNNDHAPLVNMGTGEDVTIRELAEMICEELGYEGSLAFDNSKPDGTPRKLLDVSRIHALGWHAKTPLREGIRRTYAAVREQLVPVAAR